MKRFLKRKILNWKYRKKHVILSRGTNISMSSKFEGYNTIGDNTVFSGTMGYCSYIGCDCNISADIGKYCSIASGVKTAIGTHPTRNWVSTHPSIYAINNPVNKSYVNENRFDEEIKSIHVGNDVWIGTGAIILGGVSIGDGAIIAAGAVVVKDIPPYAIVGGVPARIIRYRFKEDDIKCLLDLKWWDKEDSWIREHINEFIDIEYLKKF